MRSHPRNSQFPFFQQLVLTTPRNCFMHIWEQTFLLPPPRPPFHSAKNFCGWQAICSDAATPWSSLCVCVFTRTYALVRICREGRWCYCFSRFRRNFMNTEIIWACVNNTCCAFPTAKNTFKKKIPSRADSFPLHVPLQ